jgi:hypothetical protein
MNNKYSRAEVVVVVLFLVCLVSMTVGIYKLLYPNVAGYPCAVEVQFSGGSKATYIGRSV